MLTDTKIKSLKPKESPYKLSDGNGLFMIINPAGSKWWRFRYTLDGKEKTISVGVYPDVSLQAAREKTIECRKLVAGGIDPSDVRKEKKAEVEHTFEKVSREWLEKNKKVWSTLHYEKVERFLNADMIPYFGEKPITKITPSDVISALKKIEERGAFDRARRARRAVSLVFRYAMSNEWCTFDPAATVDNALTKFERGHFSALTDPKDVAVLLRAIDSYTGGFVVKNALCLAPYLFVRPGELRQMEWSEIDFDSGIWSIPASKMKSRQPHIVPLSEQVIDILKQVHELTGNGKYVFPNARTENKPISSCAMKVALRALGYGDSMTIHGWRAVFRTIGDEVLQFQYHHMEAQLAHCVRDPNGRAYNRTAHIEKRKEMMQTWSDYLDKLKTGCKVIPFRQKTGTDG